jgi:hypothetical protein
MEADVAHHVAVLKYHDTGATDFDDRMRRFAELHFNLVPDEGPSETVQGEVIRAVARLSSEERRNGSVNWYRGDYYENLARFLGVTLPDARVFDDEARTRIALDLQAVMDHGKGTDNPEIQVVFGRLLEDAVAYCEALPDLVPFSPPPEG